MLSSPEAMKGALLLALLLGASAEHGPKQYPVTKARLPLWPVWVPRVRPPL